MLRAHWGPAGLEHPGGSRREAWAALRYREYALLRGYRQRIDNGYVNSQDNRMVPNTFEALMLGGKLGWARYDVGYIWEIKPRDGWQMSEKERVVWAPPQSSWSHRTSTTT